jgi:hypothetical protein
MINDASKLYINLMVEEALEIPEKYDITENITRKEKINILSRFINNWNHPKLALRAKTKITIHYYRKDNEYNRCETDTARGKDVDFTHDINLNEVISFIVDKDGIIRKRETNMIKP